MNDQGDFRHSRQGLGVSLSIAAGDDDSRRGVTLGNRANELPSICLRVPGDGTGIDHIVVGWLIEVDDVIPMPIKDTAQRLCFVRIELTS